MAMMIRENCPHCGSDLSSNQDDALSPEVDEFLAGMIGYGPEDAMDETVEVPEEGLGEMPRGKTDGRIRPYEVRNPWGRKGKPKPRKSPEDLMVDALARKIEVPRKDGTMEKIPYYQYLLDSTMIAATKASLVQRVAFLRFLQKNGDLDRLDGHLSDEYQREKDEMLEELMVMLKDAHEVSNEVEADRNKLQSILTALYSAWDANASEDQAEGSV